MYLLKNDCDSGTDFDGIWNKRNILWACCWEESEIANLSEKK